MKSIVILITTALLCIAVSSVSAQVKSLEPHRIQITTGKTSNIIFQHNIVSVDRGSMDVLAQKAKGVENILQLKAAHDSLAETNLSVVTADGRLNSFILTYSPYPSILNYSLAGDPRQGTIYLSSDKVNQAELLNYSKMAVNSRKVLGGIRKKEFGVEFKLTGIYIFNNIMYFRIKIDNRSNITYDIDQLRFYIRDQKKAKRTASQETEITPVHIYENTAKVLAMDAKTLVIALPKFTIPDKKYLAIQLMEANGGRHLELHVKNKKIMWAVPLK